MKINFTEKQKGYALLMAVMVSSLFLIIAGTVAKIAAVEVILSSIGRESQFAFYAADAGIECSLYWDRHYVSGNTADTSGSAFSMLNDTDIAGLPYESGSPSGDSNRELIVADGNNGTNGTTQISCAGSRVTNFAAGDFTGGAQNQTFFRVPNLLDGSCVDVVVTKTGGGGFPIRTIIVARGYNTCNVDNPRRIERALQVISQ